MLYAIKALTNLAMSSPNINLVIGEFGAIDILLQILQSQNHISADDYKLKASVNKVMLHSLIALQSISALSVNKNQLVEKSIFLLIAS